MLTGVAAASQLAAGDSLPEQPGMLYLLESGELDTARISTDSDGGAKQVFAVMGSEKEKDRLRAEELMWRAQRRDFLKSQKEQVALHDVAGAAWRATGRGELGSNQRTLRLGTQIPHFIFSIKLRGTSLSPFLFLLQAGWQGRRGTSG